MLDGFGRDLAGDTLIDGGGIEEPVGNDNSAGSEGGKDFFPHELSSAGGEEKNLGLGGHGPAFFGMLKEMTDVFSDGSASWLAYEKRLVASSNEQIDESPDLRTLAAAFRTFKTNKETCLTRLGHAGNA